MAFFSIVIPTYNRASFIGKAIDSVVHQSYGNWELIVVDDASTDQTMAQLAAYSDPRIRILRNPVNLERSASRNKGIEAATGKYICFLDSDDYYLPDHLQALYTIIQAKNEPVALIHTDVSVRDVQGLELRRIQYHYTPDQPVVEAVLACHVQPNAVTIHRDILRQFRFDEQLSINEDVYLFAQIAALFPVFHQAQVTVAWVIHPQNTSASAKDHLTPQLQATQKIFRDPLIRVSSKFRRQKYFDLYSQLVYFHASRKKTILALLYFVRAMRMNPWHANNRNNLLNIIYYLPGGRWLKQTVQSVKSN